MKAALNIGALLWSSYLGMEDKRSPKKIASEEGPARVLLMNRLRRFLCIAHLLVFALPALAQVHFEADFNGCQAPATGTPSPIMSIPPSFLTGYGAGDFFLVEADESGNCALRISYTGKNGLCNQCGGRIVTHRSGVGTGNFAVSSTGSDLTISDDVSTATKPDDGPKARVNRAVFNTSRGASVWTIQSIGNQVATNDRLNLSLKTPGIGGQNSINVGDSLLIARTCGEDGIVGTVGGQNDIDRRSDCDQLITWFSNVPAQAPGASVFRRRYIKQTMDMSTQHQKLGYVTPDSGGPNQGSVVVFADMKDGVAVPNVSGLLRYGAPIGMYMPSNSSLAGKSFERGVWYYLEEEYQAATVKTVDSSGKPIAFHNDGAFRLWMGAEGDEPERSAPTLEVRGLALPPITGGAGSQISMWGNFQHWTDSLGSWFLDDYVVAGSYTGPRGRTQSAAPSPPALQVN